jgi:hypothetical protein
MDSVKNKTNTQLEEEKIKLKMEYESIRLKLLALTDEWTQIEKKYNKIDNELRIRYGLK